ncbi:protocatechuate 3,4-dioxygenase subunit alpha [Caulobacter sp. S45]|uniref:protocatechuate 3,4-dioxygenase subunit alpha n=1 Tax=Caulobacter sp. S45 TaxID=1641861 RepID=UPI00131B5DF1|nr:protocatechuate 3,4-dioxygenase subunit alpha [Caulobacter sp. S45]
MADNQSPEAFGQTPWQTVGPFFHYGLPWKGAADLVGGSDIGARADLFPTEHYLLNQPAPKGATAGERIEITGRVIDAAGAPIPDAMIEIWQANAAGRYASVDDGRADLPLDPDFTGFGRSSTSKDGEYRFLTVKPGRVPGPGNTLQAAHIAVGVFGRGLIKRLVTRIYFEDEPANAEDPILELVPTDRRQTLIARRTSDGTYRFDIVLQGENETVFFDI